MNPNLEKSGIRRLCEVNNYKTVGQEVQLFDSINNYDFLVVATGAIGSNTYYHQIAMPFAGQYTGAKKAKGAWRIGIDKIISVSPSGKIVLDIVSEKKLKITEFSGDSDMRAILGVSL